MNQKILLSLAYWEGDREQAERLAEFIAEMEPRHSNEADFLLVCRFDSGHTPGVIQRLGRKFNTFSYKSPLRMTGWPAGCNATWEGAVNWVWSMTEAKKLPPYKAILTFEADCVPTAKDWIQKLHQSWNSVQPAVVAGALVSGEGVEKHINGNCLISGQEKFLRWVVQKANIPANMGWDYFLRHQFEQFGWANVSGIRSLYNSQGYTEEKWQEIQDKDIFLIHGAKDNTLINLARKHLLGRA
jgi:hypothetical protein